MTLEEMIKKAGYNLENDTFFDPAMPTLTMFKNLEASIRYDQRKRHSRLVLRRLKKDMKGFDEKYIEGYMKAVERCHDDILKGYGCER